MKNNIKNKLIEAANKQQINDLSDEIIRKVDTTKVLNSTPSRKKSFNFAPFIFAGATACTLAVVIGVSIGLNVNRGTNTNNPTNSAFDFTNTSSEEVQRLLNKISTQESYNIINIANSLDVVLDDVKNNNASIEEGIMNPEIEIALAKDFNPYIYNIEAMYDLYDPIVSTVSNNTNSLYSYEKDLKIVSPYYEYHLYYDEVITEQKNANEDNYKEKSDIDGIIICGFNAYDFETHKTIKNDTVEYKSTIYVSTTKYVEIDSKFTTDRNIYTYTYYNDNETKEVNIEQKIKEENTTEVEFKSRKTVVDERVKYSFELVVTANINKSLNCKIKSRNTKPCTVERLENNTHKYSFISGNNYIL